MLCAFMPYGSLSHRVSLPAHLCAVCTPCIIDNYPAEPSVHNYKKEKKNISTHQHSVIVGKKEDQKGKGKK